MTEATHDRPWIASLAHAKAHEVSALRGLRDAITAEHSVGDVVALINERIAVLQADVARMATQMEPGHA